MHIGKSKVVLCDHCGKALTEEEADSSTRNGKVRHFCRGNCMNEYYLEQLGSEAERRTYEKYRHEYNLIYKMVCPACKWRLKRLL